MTSYRWLIDKFFKGDDKSLPPITTDSMEGTQKPLSGPPQETPQVPKREGTIGERDSSLLLLSKSTLDESLTESPHDFPLCLRTMKHLRLLLTSQFDLRVPSTGPVDTETLRVIQGHRQVLEYFDALVNFSEANVEAARQQQQTTQPFRVL